MSKIKYIMKGSVFILVFVVSWLGLAHAQEKKVDSSAVGLSRTPVIQFFKLDTIPVPQSKNNFKPVEMPNLFNQRPLAVKDAPNQMPVKMLDGSNNAVMPGSEPLDKLAPNDRLQRRIKLNPDSLQLRVQPRKEDK